MSSQAGILPSHTRSEVDGLETFHPLSPQDMYDPSDKEWFQRMAVNMAVRRQCCSIETATFHYIKSKNMMTCMNYFIYNRTYSIL
jgi:hypothetical protein